MENNDSESDEDTNNSGVCTKCWNAGDVGYVCRTCNMGYYQAVWNFDTKERAPCDAIFRGNRIFGAKREAPREIKDGSIQNGVQMFDVDLRRSFTLTHTTDEEWKYIDTQGLCDKLHYVGQIGGYCPLCDDENIPSRLRDVAVDANVGKYTIDYVAFAMAEGVKKLVSIPLKTDVTFEEIPPPLIFGEIEVFNLVRYVMNSYLPQRIDDKAKYLVKLGILVPSDAEEEKE
jgi:hypothetical protein